jgi:phenylacetate-coenzyme A ligase PaaK-like adenylate-forming protein
MKKINKELKYLLNLTYETTPFWREKFEVTRLKPNDIDSVDELLMRLKRLYLHLKFST